MENIISSKPNPDQKAAELANTLKQGAAEMKFRGMEKFHNYFRMHSHLTFLPLLTNWSRKKRVDDAKDILKDWRTSSDAPQYRRIYLNAAFLCEAAGSANPKLDKTSRKKAISEVAGTIDTLFLYNLTGEAKKTASMIVGKMLEHGHKEQLDLLMSSMLYQGLFAQKYLSSDGMAYAEKLALAGKFATAIGSPKIMIGMDVQVGVDVKEHSENSFDEHDRYKKQKLVRESDVDKYFERAELLAEMMAFNR